MNEEKGGNEGDRGQVRLPQPLADPAGEEREHRGRRQPFLRVHGLGHAHLLAPVPCGGHAVEQALFDRVQRGLAALDGAHQVEQAQVRHGSGLGNGFAWHARGPGLAP